MRRLFWAHAVGRELRRSSGRAVVLGAGTMLAAAAFATLSVGLGAPSAVVSGAADPVAPPVLVQADAAGVSAEETAAMRMIEGMRAVAPLSLLGVTDLDPGAGAAGGGAWRDDQGAAGARWATDLGGAAWPGAGGLRVLIAGIDPVAQDAAAEASGGAAVFASAMAPPQDPASPEAPQTRPPVAAAALAALTPRGAELAPAVLAAHAGGGGQRVAAYERADGVRAAAASVTATPDRAAPVVRVQALIDPEAARGVLAPAQEALEGVAFDAVVFVAEADAARLGSPQTFAPVVDSAVRGVVLVPAGEPGSALFVERARVAAELVATTTALTVRVGGAPVTLSERVDAKSVLLIGALAAVSAAFVVNATAAALRTRRRELRTLRALGWGRVRMAGLVLAEHGVVAGAAGLPAAALAVIAIPLLWPAADPWRGAWALVIAPVLCLGAALPSIWAATAPAARPSVRRGRGGRGGAVQPARGVVAFAVRNVLRVPARAVLGAVAIAVSAAALTIVLAVWLGFGGAVVGSVLSAPLAVRGGPIDLVAAGTLLLLGCVSLADITALNMRDRRDELRALRLVGWPAGRMARMLAVESTLVALVGAGSGALLATLALVVLVPAAAEVGLVSGAVAGAAVLVVAGVVALVPMMRSRTRMPLVAG